MKDGIFLVMDEGNSRCGLTDRLKTAVGLCYTARLHGLDFYLIHNAGFDLKDYLAPNRIDWSASLSDISDDPGDRQEIHYVAPYTDFPSFHKGVQYICRKYIGNNLIEKRNVPDWQKVWRKLFLDMFTPSQSVRNFLAACKMPERYTAVAARFINSLGQTEDADYNRPFPAEMRKRLIDAVLEKAAECRKEANSPIVVYSDSVPFLEAAKEKGFLTTDTAGVGNIMNGNLGEYVTLRTFVNFFQMAGADRVYSILHMPGFPENSLYKTQYPRYAAIVGNRPFIRL